MVFKAKDINLYHAFELNHAVVKPWRHLASAGKHLYQTPLNPLSYTWAGKNISAACKVFEDVTKRYPKPEWRLDKTRVNAFPVPVKERKVWQKPFASLLHFERNPAALAKARPGKSADPRVLIVAPLSGHYATLLRRTVEAFLPDHEVYISDWTDARNVPVSQGKFDLNDYVDYVIEMIEFLGKGVNVIAICQPGPPVLAAISLLSKQNVSYLPATMTYMGSPIDGRISPQVPNQIALEKNYEWFRDNMIHTVPWPNPGHGRKVYPGFLQLGGFISMNRERHVSAHKKYFKNLVKGDWDSIEKHTEFYDEYLAVLDLSAEFYLQTIKDVFQDFKIPKREFEHHGQIADPDDITEVALMTVEGERDDISGVGQTAAAQDLCSRLPDTMKTHYLQPGVGHYGIFSGKAYRNDVQPRISKFILEHFDKDEELTRQTQRPELIRSLN